MGVRYFVYQPKFQLSLLFSSLYLIRVSFQLSSSHSFVRLVVTSHHLLAWVRYLLGWDI